MVGEGEGVGEAYSTFSSFRQTLPRLLSGKIRPAGRGYRLWEPPRAVGQSYPQTVDNLWITFSTGLWTSYPQIGENFVRTIGLVLFARIVMHAWLRVNSKPEESRLKPLG